MVQFKSAYIFSRSGDLFDAYILHSHEKRMKMTITKFLTESDSALLDRSLSSASVNSVPREGEPGTVDKNTTLEIVLLTPEVFRRMLRQHLKDGLVHKPK